MIANRPCKVKSVLVLSLIGKTNYKQNIMNKELRERLKKYGLGAGAIVAGTAASAQMVYTDIVPDDTVSGAGDSYQLDLDNNSSTDFNIAVYSGSFSSSYYGFFLSYQSISVQGYGSNRVMNDSSNYPYALNNGDPINNNAGSWAYGGDMFSHFYLNSYSTFSGTFGNWTPGTNDKYLGLRLDVSGTIHYGWARISVITENTFVIKDYAYQSQGSIPTSAGDTSSAAPAQALPATNIVGTDISNFGSGADLQVTFDMAADETGIEEYHLLIVKDANAGSFTMADAQAVSALNRTDITPSGTNITQNMTFGSRDVDGDLLAENVPYRIFVLSVADNINAFTDTLSQMSNQVTLTTPVIPTDPATNVVASDVDNNGNGSDLSVSFTKAADESGIGEYRIIVAREASAATFDLAAAQALNVSQYVAVTPTGSNITTVLVSTLRDTDGNLIEEQEPYRVFIHSVADNTNATVDTLSGMSNQVTLLGPTADIASNLVLSDVADYANGLDLQLSFTKALDESTVSTYRVIIVKSANAATFDRVAAESLGIASYKTTYPNGTNPTVVMNASTLDSDGDPITSMVPYKAFVLSMADGTNATANSLSGASNEITLNWAAGVASVDGSAGLVVNQAGNALQLRHRSGEAIVAATLYDVNGKLIKTHSNHASEMSVSVEGMATGMYILEARTNGQTMREKVFITVL